MSVIELMTAKMKAFYIMTDFSPLLPPKSKKEIVLLPSFFLLAALAHMETKKV